MESTEQLDLVSTGINLPPAKFPALKSKLSKNCDDLKTRLKLSGFYWQQESRILTPTLERLNNMLWIIENFSNYSDLIQIYMQLDDHPPRLWRKVAECWNRQVIIRSTTPAVLFNAAMFLINRDFDKAEMLLHKSMEIDPSNGVYSFELCQRYSGRLFLNDNLNLNTAQLCLEEGLRARTLGLPYLQAGWECCMRIAHAAFLLEDYSLAAKLCEEAPVHQFNDPPAQEFKHALLGLIALKNRDAVTACRHLSLTEEFSRKSSLTILLLEELLKTDNQTFVTGYLERYFKTPISMEEAPLWLEDMKQGLTP